MTKLMNIGYVIWPKIEHDQCYGEKQLHRYLEKKDSPLDPDYAQAVLRMRQSILDAIDRLTSRRIFHVRIGVSWAEAATVGGRQWIEWYLARFAKAGFDILPCINYTPRDLAQARIELLQREILSGSDVEFATVVSNLTPQTNIPPEPISAFGAFMAEFIELSQQLNLALEWIECWNEPNIDSDWHPHWGVAPIPLFVEMLDHAARVIRQNGMKVLMGGLSSVKPEWLDMACNAGLLNHVDAIGLHGLRGTWSDKKVRPSWQERVLQLQEVMRNYGTPVPVWITECGFATIDFDFKINQNQLERIQVAVFAEALEALESGATPRVYWYADMDLIADSVRFVTTGWEDIIQYFFGDTTVTGRKKLLRILLEIGGPEYVLEYARVRKLMPLGATIIDRGDPGQWSTEKLRAVVEQYKQNEIA